jgi:exportin-2 (importin alpha re-exporter)
MRVIFVSKEDMAPYAKNILERLVSILELISKNPSNPKFNHYVFESIGSLVRFLCGFNLAFVPEFESLLFPPIQAILQMDIPEFTPYVLQIMSQLLELNQGSGIPDSYTAFLPPILQPPLWEMQGNIPALVRLLQAYLTHGKADIVTSNQLPAFLGIFQKLIASRANDQHGFDLLVSVFNNVPIDQLSPFLKQVFNILLLRLQSSKTPKYSQGFMKFVCTFACMHTKIPNSARIVVDTMDSIQPK